MFIKKYCKICILIFSAFIFFSLGSTAGAVPPDNSWNKIETRYAVINYQSLKDLSKFNKHVEYGDNGGINLRFFGLGTDKLLNTISRKVDSLYERAQEILDMRRKMKKVIINIYPDKDSLHKAYEEIYNQPCNIRAWYIFDKNTVYVNVNDLHEGMLAHEIAHSIIDHYLLMSPPAATAEILARYVDGHLHDPSVTGTLKKSPHTLSSFSEE